METIDFAKTQKHLYTAKRRVEEVAADTATFFAAEGQGEPGGEAFQQAIQCLFSATYTAKFALKYEGVVDFKVAKLECLYLCDPCKTHRSKWRWRLLFRVPDVVTAKHLAQARKSLKDRKGLDASAVKRVRWKEGRAVQVLHGGPYDQVGSAFSALDGYAKEHGLVTQCAAHEIYLSDPRRVAPAKLKTIVRLPVKKA